MNGIVCRETKRCLAAFAAVFVTTVAEAVQIDFPAGKSGELTDTSVLPLDKRPTASDWINFDWQTLNPLALTVSNTNEFMLGGLRFESNDGQRFTITVADGTTVKLPRPDNGRATEFRKRRILGTFKGGIWDFCGTGDYWCNGTYNVGHYCTNILDGVIFTNVNRFIVSDYTAGCSVTLTNGARVSASEVQLTRDGNNISPTLAITGGSTLKATSSVQISSGGSDSHGRIVVTGADSKLTIPGHWTMSYGTDMGWCVRDGGSVELTGSANFDYSTVCKDNFVEVDGGSFVCKTLEIGQTSSGTTNFQLRVLNGGSFDSGTNPIRLYKNATIIVSNATFSCGGVSDCSGDNCHIKLYGPLTTFSWDRSASSLYYFFTAGKNHSIELDDHASWMLAQAFEWGGNSASSCRFSLANGSTLTIPNIDIGYTTQGGSSPSNEVSVSSGSVLTMTESAFSCGKGTRVVVSNATIRLNGFNLGQDGSEGARFIFRGTTPRLIESTHLYIQGAGGTLEYDLSGGPYELGDGVAPAEVGQLYVIADTMCIKLKGLGSLAEKLTQKTRMPIFKCTSFWSETTKNRLDAAIAAENESIAAEFGPNRHVLTRDGKTIYLTARPRNSGLCIYVR